MNVRCAMTWSFLGIAAAVPGVRAACDLSEPDDPIYVDRSVEPVDLIGQPLDGYSERPWLDHGSGPRVLGKAGAVELPDGTTVSTVHAGDDRTGCHYEAVRSPVNGVVVWSAAVPNFGWVVVVRSVLLSGLVQDHV